MIGRHEHEHKYFPFEKMTGFERVQDSENPDMFERIEWVIMTCNCGDVIKRRVRVHE